MAVRGDGAKSYQDWLFCDERRIGNILAMQRRRLLGNDT